MRKFFQIIGVVTVALAASVAVAVAFVAYRGQALNREGRTYVDKAVPAITARWSEKQLLDRASPGLRRTLSQARLAAVFQRFAQLGPLVHYEGADRQSLMSTGFGSGRTVAAAYVAKAVYANGRATIRLAVVERHGRWMISGFHVDYALNATPDIGI